ncbi:glycosyltransferase [Nonomuraea sp. KM88]|uniref:glycosyltransferase n=1 Tax=Nonomuraea sp. KM88 TaxID=3457427 RepID=UPI003FCE0DE3
MIGKYPPIQGGVSREMLWDSYALASMGHEVHVVTNASEVEAAFRVQDDLYAGQPGADPREESAVRVHQTASDPRTLRYVPFANPFVSKLAGTAARVVEDHGPFDFVYGYYLEPYGVAAHLVSTWTGVPYGLRHAGSDIGRLYRHDGLRETYGHVARSADFWIAPTLTSRGLHHLGVEPERLHRHVRHSVPTPFFHQDAEPMNVAAVQDRINEDGELNGVYRRRERSFRQGEPTLGMYGKAGDTKGMSDLLRAFAATPGRDAGHNVVIATSGPATEVRRLYALAEQLGIQRNLTFLPFMPPWKVPSFIAACDAVAFLERDFPIGVHRPLVPREILACGGCLILSRDVARYQLYADQLRDTENCLLADPRDVGELGDAIGRALGDPVTARAIGRRGHDEISRELEDWEGYVTYVADNFARIASEAESRRTEMTMAETQAALARLYVDEAFRGWFAHAPEEALRKYELTEPEKDTLKAIDKKMVDLFAQTLRDKRRGRLVATFPLTSRVCGREVVGRYFERYYDLHPAQPNMLVAEHAMAFGRFLVDCIAVTASLPSYATDLCRYEQAMSEMRLTPLPTDDLLLLDAVPPEGANVAPEARPVLAPGIRVLRFDYDIPSIADAVERGEAPESARRTPVVLVMRVLPQGLPEAFRVNEATAALLDLCTGDRTPAQITALLATRFGKRAGIEEALSGALTSLLARNVVRVGAEHAPTGADESRGA